MRKLLTGIVVLTLANLAFAVPAFDIAANPTEFQVGETKTLTISVDAIQGVAGMSLNLETMGNFEIMDIVIDTGTIFEGNTTGAGIYTQLKPLPDGTEVPANLGIGSVTTATGTVAGPGIVALVSIKAIGNINDVGILTTGSEILGASDLLAASGAPLGVAQATADLKIIPEPVSALLLLAGLPLIRRRRA